MDKKLDELSEVEFLNIIKFNSEAVTEYLESVLYDFIAYYIATGLK